MYSLSVCIMYAHPAHGRNRTRTLQYYYSHIVRIPIQIPAVEQLVFSLRCKQSVPQAKGRGVSPVLTRDERRVESGVRSERMSDVTERKENLESEIRTRLNLMGEIPQKILTKTDFRRNVKHSNTRYRVQPDLNRDALSRAALIHTPEGAWEDGLIERWKQHCFIHCHSSD